MLKVILTTGGLNQYISSNRNFVKTITARQPNFFKELALGQSPEILWIGCADSRVPETTILDRSPGEVFVHRNVANIIRTEDLNSGSVIQFAVAVLKVKRIIVCGHTNCGGALASLGDDDLGPILNGWLQPLRDLRKKYQADIDAISSNSDKAVKLAELNVKQAISILQHKESVANAIAERNLEVHGAIFNLASGELQFLN